jgi:citrate lyase subunit beta / citryl-CoA lyase
MSELPPLTWLYVPASRPERVPKALASGAHAVIVDLEDGVAPADKAQARAGLAELFRDLPAVRVHVRVNGLGTPWAEDDLAAVRELAIHGVHVPKVESTDLPDVGERELHCLVETPLGVERAFEIASAPSVRGLSLGEADLRAETGAGDAGLDWARGRVVNAALAAGLPRPPQSVFADINDLEGLAASCARGRELGFLGRTAVHPKQLAVIEQAYLPTSAEVERARTLLAAAANEGGAFALDGAMVDAPFVAAARNTVALAERYGLRDV